MYVLFCSILQIYDIPYIKTENPFKNPQKERGKIMAYSLNDLKVGQSATVDELNSSGSIRRRLLDIGLIGNTKVECIGKSPSGDPKAFLIRGAVIAIRSEDCEGVLIKNIFGEG